MNLEQQSNGLIMKWLDIQAYCNNMAMGDMSTESHTAALSTQGGNRLVRDAFYFNG